jgi:hypothetical protein
MVVHAPFKDFTNDQCDETRVASFQDVVQDHVKLLINASGKVGFLRSSLSLFDFGQFVVTIALWLLQATLSTMINDYCCKILIYSFEMRLKASII